MCRELILEIELPIYRTSNKKTGKQMLLGYNQVSNLQKHYKNHIKSEYEAIIANKIGGWDKETYEGKYVIEYELFYPHARLDLSNVCTITDKYLCDAMQTCGIVKSDNVNNCIGVSFKVAGKDTDRPRVVAKVFKGE